MNNSFYPAPQQNIRSSDLWVIRMYYVALVGGLGFISPFLNLFYARQGLTGSQIGLITGIGSLVAVLSAPVWTRQVARSSNPRLVLQVSTLAYGLVFLWIGQQNLFIWIALLTALRVLVSAGINPIADTLAVRAGNATGSGYGSVRVWGSLGWAVSTLASGWLMERLGVSVGFTGLLATAIAGALLLFLLGKPVFLPPSARPILKAGTRQGLQHLLRNRVLIGLAFMYLFIGLSNAGVVQFEIIYLSQLGARVSVLGIASMVGSVVELGGMFLADRLISRRGPSPVLMISMLMSALLRGLVFLFPSVETIILARAATGISFSLFTVAVVRLIAENTSPQDTATTLALFTVTLVSLVGFVGSPLAGFLFDRLGAHWLYPISLGGYLLGWIALSITRPAAVVAKLEAGS